MAYGTQDSDEIISGINVTPLVDIVLVVLIIFMVTASFVLRSQIPVDLPKAQSAEESAGGLINLALTRDGGVYLNGRPKTLDELEPAIATLRDQLRAEGKPVSAFVSADVQTPYGLFAGVVDRLRVQGIADIALDTRPTDVVEK